jgi:hypothetical protein
MVAVELKQLLCSGIEGRFRATSSELPNPGLHSQRTTNHKNYFLLVEVTLAVASF